MTVWVKSSLHCTCGSSWRGELPMSVWQFLLAEWNKEHRGEGHGYCTVKEAAEARRERRARKSLAKVGEAR